VQVEHEVYDTSAVATARVAIHATATAAAAPNAAAPIYARTDGNVLLQWRLWGCKVAVAIAFEGGQPMNFHFLDRRLPAAGGATLPPPVITYIGPAQFWSFRRRRRPVASSPRWARAAPGAAAHQPRLRHATSHPHVRRDFSIPLSDSPHFVGDAGFWGWSPNDGNDSKKHGT